MALPSIAAEAPYRQKALGPTPFSSVRSRASDSEVHLATRSDAHAQKHCQATRISYGVARGGDAPGIAGAWAHPPPTATSVSRRQPKIDTPADAPPPLPKDTLHPLVSAMQAAENAKAVSLNPAVRINSNAARTGPPCEAHANLARRQQSGSGATTNDRDHRGDDDEDEGSDADDDDGGAYTAATATRGAGGASRHSRRGDVKTAVGRAYNAEGGYHEPEQYTGHVVDFASSQPTSATAFAAKALASAMHDAPSHAIPAAASAEANFRPKPNSGVAGPSANRHLHAGLFQRDGSVVPPSPAFRQLPEHTRALLVNRPLDARAAAENTVRDSNAARHALETQPIVGEENDRLDELVGRGGASDIWADALKRCGARPLAAAQPLPTSHPTSDVLASRQFRIVNPEVVSLYSSHSTRPMAAGLLGGVGLRIEDSLTQVKLPSEASFLGDPSRAKRVKQFANIPYTPCNAYGFDSNRFRQLLSENGLEVEELQLEGASHIASLSDVPQYCPNLRIVHLGGCTQLDAATVAAMARQCKQLAYINLSRTDVGCDALQSLLTTSSNLMTLCLSGLPKINAEADLAFSMLHRHRHIRVLDLSHCPEVTDVALCTVAQYCPGLEVLDITGCFALTDESVLAIGSSCPALRVWKLAMCAGLTAEGLMGLALAPRGLEVLDVSGCTALTNACVERIVCRVPEMQYLAIAGCTAVDDAAVQSVTRHCPKLAVLNIASCVGVSMASCMALIHELPQLLRLVVSESSISNAEVVMLSSLRETCEIVRNQFRPVAPRTIIGYRAPEVKKAVKGGDKGKGKGKK